MISINQFCLHIHWEQKRWHHCLTLTRLIIDALRNLTAISTTTASFDKVSCLNKAPQVATVDDFKNCRTEKRKRGGGAREDRLSQAAGFIFLLNQRVKVKGESFLVKYFHLTWLECVVKAKMASMYLLRFAGTSTSTSEPCGKNLNILLKSLNICMCVRIKHRYNTLWNNVWLNYYKLTTNEQSWLPSAQRTWHNLFRKQ